MEGNGHTLADTYYNKKYIIMNIEFTLEDWEQKVLSTDMLGISQWIETVAKNKARIVGDRIVDKVVAYCNENSIQLAVGKEAQIQQAFDLGIVRDLSTIEDSEEV